MKTERKEYLEYRIGRKDLISHVDAVHAQPPKSDQFTREIVSGVIQEIDASVIIATISRKKMNLNESRNDKNALAVDEYRETIKEIINSKDIFNERGKLVKNYLHLAIHGMKNRSNTEFEIGTSYGKSCSPEVEKWFITKLKLLSKNFGINDAFSGVRAKIECHRKGDKSSNYLGYGDLFNTIQVEINRDWREKRQIDLINFFSEVIIDFKKDFNF